MKKTVVSNGILNGIKQSSQVLFSLITIPYITRVLGVERYGTINYSNSVVSYFVLLAALGINTYAVREGSIRRRNKFKISEFASEMFSINIISTLIAYLLLFITISINRFAPYREIMLIQSLVIIFNTVGMDWVNVVLNLFFISRFNYLGASITTVFSELIVAIMGFLYAKKRKLAQSLLSFKDLLSYIAGGICVLVICIFIQNTVINDLVSIITSAVTALFAYIVVLCVFKNSVIRGMIANLNVSHRK